MINELFERELRNTSINNISLADYINENYIVKKTGHWIEHPEIKTSTPEYLMFYECSECGDKQCFCKSDIHKKHFCNNCGAGLSHRKEREGMSKDEIMKLQTYKMFEGEDTVYVRRDDILEILEQEPKWIPVSERLPEKNVEVLVTTEWDCITIGEMFSINDWFIHEGATNADIDDIKAWMPLPEPYKAESEG